MEQGNGTTPGARDAKETILIIHLSCAVVACYCFYLLHVRSSLSLFLRRRGGCDESELLVIAWDRGRTG